MNLDRLNQLNDLADQAEKRILLYNETAVCYRGYFPELAGLFQHKADISKAAKVRILQAIYNELVILKTNIQIEIEHEKAD